MVKLFGEVGGGVPEYLSSKKFFNKLCSKKLSWENSSKNITAGVQLMENNHDFTLVHGRLRSVCKACDVQIHFSGMA